MNNNLLAPGVYDDLPEDIYHALPYASASRLNRAAAYSWAHVKHDMDNPLEPTPAMQKGTAVHMATLEPELFDVRYDVAGPCEGTTAKGAPCKYGGSVRIGGKWYCGTHAKQQNGHAPDNVEVLSQAFYDDVIGMRDSLLTHPRLGRLFDAPGRAELSIIWDETLPSGAVVRCKARLDREIELPSAGHVLVDIKSTNDARAHAFQRTMVERGYYRQASMYRRALAAHDLPPAHLVFAAVESSAPYAARGYRLEDDAAVQGHNEITDLLEGWHQCQESGIWPGYADDVEALTLPNWKWYEIDNSEVAI